jgi:hypothetical protein
MIDTTDTSRTLMTMSGALQGLDTKVVYIGGVGRSGSTLLGRILGEAPNAVCVGETRYIWARGVRDNVECGCGKAFRECPFWDAVGMDAFGGWDQIQSELVAELDRAMTWPHTIPAYVATQLPRNVARRTNAYISYLATLYAAISRISKATTIIDTSKAPGFANLLQCIPGGDLRIVHLVRDSRAVAYSWNRRKRLPSPLPGHNGQQEFMTRSKAVAILASKYLGWNSAFHLPSLHQAPYLRLRYENFVADPIDGLRVLSAFSGETLTLPESHFKDNSVQLGNHHIFSGNPMRERMGLVPIKLDDEWRTLMPQSQFHQVTAITSPLLRLYGYPLRRGPDAPVQANRFA